jgi:hypothetical protein
MKRVLLVMVVSAMLVTLGFAQTPDAGSNTGPANVKGCLGGSEGSYTVVEDGTGQIFKITTSSVDLKLHVSHDVKLIGHKATGAVSSGAADNSFAVTELSMISEHCAAAAAAPAATVTPSPQTVIPPDAAAAPATASTPAVDAAAPAAPVNPPSATASAPAVDAAAPTATVSPSAATVSTPAVQAAVPAATVSPSAATVSTPAVQAPVPAATVSPSSATVSTPLEAAHAPRPSAHARKLAAAQAAAATAPDTRVSPSPADVATPAAAASPSAEAVSAPEAAAPSAVTPAPAVTHRAGSLTLLISFVVLVIVLGTMAPLIGRWRKRKMLERTGSPNLSFTNEVSTKAASSDQDKPEPRKVA